MDPLFDISKRIAVVTGACGLIGRLLARSFHDRGAQVALVDIAAANPSEMARSIGKEVVGLECDVTNAGEVAELVAKVRGHFGKVDILINGHTYRPRGWAEANAESFPEELWDQIMEVNLKGTFLTCREFGRAMLEQGSGSIINFASTYGVVSSNPDLYEGNSLGNPVAYSVSKAGVIMLTRYLGVHWASRGVRVNCVTPHGVLNHQEPGFVERFSAKSPMKRLMRVDEVVGAVLFLASEASSYATGSNVLIEGGWTGW